MRAGAPQSAAECQGRDPHEEGDGAHEEQAERELLDGAHGLTLHERQQARQRVEEDLEREDHQIENRQRDQDALGAHALLAHGEAGPEPSPVFK